MPRTVLGDNARPLVRARDRATGTVIVHPPTWLSVGIGTCSRARARRIEPGLRFLAESPVGAIYVPLAPASGGTFVIRTAGSPRAALASLTDIARDLDPDLPIANAQTMELAAVGAVYPRATTLSGFISMTVSQAEKWMLFGEAPPVQSELMLVENFR